MDAIAVYKKAVDQTGRIVGAVKPNQFGDATPCDDWDVRALLNHTIAVAKAFGDAAGGKPFDFSLFAEGVDNVGSDPGSAYDDAAKTIHSALASPGVLDGNWHMPFGEVPASIAIGFCTLELSQHGWDVARATGQKVDFDPEVGEVAMATAQAAPAEQVRVPGVFGQASDCPESAPLQDRIAAFLGRKV